MKLQETKVAVKNSIDFTEGPSPQNLSNDLSS